MDKDSKPLISVIMPVYNSELYIADSVNSILSQTHEKFELIIIDDSSIDATRDIINSYNDPRIKLITKQRRGGITESLNIGIEMAEGKYIARMDGDDISNPNRFFNQVSLFESRANLICCGTGYEEIDSAFEFKPEVTHEDIILKMVDQCPMAHPTIMLRGDLLKKNKLKYDPEFEPAEDYKMWADLIFYGEFANINESLLEYRTHPNQTSSVRKIEQQKKSDLVKLLFLEKLGLTKEEISNLLLIKITKVEELDRYQSAEKVFISKVSQHFGVSLNKQKLHSRIEHLIEKNFYSRDYSPRQAFLLTKVLLKQKHKISLVKYLKYLIKSMLHYKAN